jgi:amino acid efflux transporter
VTGGWFLCAVLLGAPAVSLIGGYYVADLTGSGTLVATIVGLAMFGAVLVANVLGLRVSAAFQLGLASVLVVVMAVAITVALPSRGGHNWTPFAPHGWWAVGTAANILIWLFLGWEAVAQLAGDFRRPEVDLPKAMGLAFAVVVVMLVLRRSWVTHDDAVALDPNDRRPRDLVVRACADPEPVEAARAANAER